MRGESYGWTEIIQPWLAHESWKVNASDAITLWVPQFASYDVDSPETLTLIVPPNALASRQRVRATGVVHVDAARGVAFLSGSLLKRPTEAALRSCNILHLVVVLHGDTWTHAVGLNSEPTASLVAGLSSAQREADGFNGVVQPLLSFRDLSRLNDGELRITLPQRARYSIAAPETLSLNIPAT